MWNKALIALLAMLTAPAWAAMSLGYSNAQSYPYTYVANSGSPGALIPTDFVGISFEESACVQTLSLNNNTGLKNILSVMGTTGSVRFGGNTTDTNTPLNSRVTDCANFVFSLGSSWTAIYSVGCIQTTGNIQAEVTAFDGIVATTLYAIGNEPNFYAAGACSGSFSNYQTQWSAQRTSILSTSPSVHFEGPDTGVSLRTGADTYTPLFAANLCASASLLTAHSYGGDDSGDATIGALFMWNATTMSTEVTGMPVDASVAACGKPLRLTESGTTSNVGVGNTLAASLYDLWEMILLAQNGWKGVNFHEGDATAVTGGYIPVTNNGSNIYSAQSTLYAMRMFEYLSGGNILPATTNTLPASIPGICVLISSTTKCLLVNKNLTVGFGVLLGTTSFSSCAVMLYTGAAYNSTTVTLGAATISTSGAFSPTTITVAKSGSTCPVWIPASSAVLVTLS